MLVPSITEDPSSLFFFLPRITPEAFAEFFSQISGTDDGPSKLFLQSLKVVQIGSTDNHPQ